MTVSSARRRRLKASIFAVFLTVYLLVHIRFQQSTSWSSRGTQYVSVSLSTEVTAGTVETDLEPEGYVSYLPHSGFNNQRQQLENALMVAYIMNRTLIVPPLYLGHANILSWKPFWNLTRQLDIVETLNYNRLFSQSKNDTEISPLLLEHLNPDSPVAMIPFSAIFDLDSLSKKIGVRLITVTKFINLQILERPEDLLLVRDNERYAYKLIDGIPHATDLIDNWTNNFDMNVVNALKPLASNLVGNLKENGTNWFVLKSLLCKSDYNSMRFVESALYNNHSRDTNHHKTYMFPTTGMESQTSEELESQTSEECPLGKSGLKSPETPMVDETKIEIAVEMEKYSHLVNLQGSWEISYDSKIDNRKRELYFSPRLIQFGSLFGKSRIELLSPRNKAVMETIKTSLILKNSILSNIVDKIIGRLGGRGNYVAMHLRIGDGGFWSRKNSTVSSVIATVRKWMYISAHKNLSHVYLAADVSDIFASEHLQQLIHVLQKELNMTVTTFNTVSNDILSMFNEFDEWRMKSLSDGSTQSQFEWQNEISRLVNYELRIIDPKRSLSNSVRVSLSERNEKIIEYLERFKDENREQRDGMSTFSEMWIPFVDQLVCSRAKSVIGTRVSTFSDYIKRLFVNYWTGQNTDEDHLFIAV